MGRATIVICDIQIQVPSIHVILAVSSDYILSNQYHLATHPDFLRKKNVVELDVANNGFREEDLCAFVECAKGKRKRIFFLD